VAYGGGLENRSPTLSGRGFESHPLRHLRDSSPMMARRLFVPDESGNYKSSLAIVIITFLVSTRSLARESKLANESLSSG
jgi:hypothetical protein